jgi:hypothetical protein
VADNHRRRAGVFQHAGADISRKRAGRFGVAILAAERDAACGSLHRPV